MSVGGSVTITQFSDSRERHFLSETRRALLNAPFVEGGWHRALDMVARATASRGVNLVCLGEGLPSLNLITGFDQELVDRHFADPSLWGAHNWRVGTATEPFEIQHDLHYRDYRERVRTANYCDVSHQLEMPHGCQTIFGRDMGGFIGLAVMRDRRDGPASTDCVDRFAMLSGLVARALKSEMAMAGEGIRTALADIDDSPAAMVLLNRHGWACGMSRSAEALLSEGSPLRIRGARLGAADRVEDSRLQQLLAFMLHRDTVPGGSVVLALRGLGGERWRVTCTPLPPTLLALGFEPQVAIRFERAQGSPTTGH